MRKMKYILMKLYKYNNNISNIITLKIKIQKHMSNYEINLK